jgi:hypothetical protein
LIVGSAEILCSQPLGNSGATDGRQQFDKIDPQLSYSPGLEAAVNLILGDPGSSRFHHDTDSPNLLPPALKLAAVARSVPETQ